jgi:K+-transporting ATPase ATPase A chain
MSAASHLYALMRLQAVLPFNPAGSPAAWPRSFVQHRDQLHHQHQLAELRRRNTMSYLVQMAGLTVQNFLSAATGIALAMALIRGFARARPRPSAISGSI